MEKKKKTFIILTLILLALILVGTVIISKMKPKVITTQPVITKQKTSSGKVYLTLKNKKDHTFGIYFFDLAQKKLKPIYTSKDCDLLGGAVTNKDLMPVTTNCTDTINNHQSYQIYADKLDNTKKAQKLITGSSPQLKKEISWSLDNKQIAFIELMPKEQQKGKLANIEQWKIFVSNMTGKKQFIGTGIHPFFAPGNKKIIALRKEGVFLFDIAKGIGESIFLRPAQKNFPFDINTSLALSPQKNKLALANSAIDKLLIYKVNFQEKELSKMVNGLKTIDLKGNHILAIQFNPKNENYLITVETTPKGETNLVLRNIKTNTTKTILNLNNYSQFQINDWK